MRSLADFEKDKSLRRKWERLHHAGLAPEPLPVTPGDALCSYILKGHALYLPVDADKTVNALVFVVHGM